MQKGASKREAEKSVLQRTTQQTWCRQPVWTFNLGIHYATKHGGVQTMRKQELLIKIMRKKRHRMVVNHQIEEQLRLFSKRQKVLF